MKQRGKVVAALLMALGLCALSARAVDEPRFTYYYQLEKVDTQGIESIEGHTARNSYYYLYVSRQGDGAPPLHAGSIALATKEHTLQFAPAEHWTMLPQERPKPEAGAATEERETYLSFSWGVKAPDAGGEGYEIPEEADGRQRIGILTVVENSGITLDEITLLPWPETVTGAARVKEWQDEADPARKKAYLMALQSVWRMDDGSRPADGYYQGYYQWSEPAETEGGAPVETQRAVDIQNGWQSFRVQSYNPFKDVTLTVTNAENTSKTEKYDSAAQGSGAPGRVTFTPDLAKLGTLADGTYTLTVSKPSHVTITYTGLTVGNGKVFPELTGKVCYLPCGDVTGGADGGQDQRIKQADRAYLTRPAHYGKPAAKTDLLDLDGDGHIGQRDLAILIAPQNYGKAAKTIRVASGTEGGTT